MTLKLLMPETQQCGSELAGITVKYSDKRHSCSQKSAVKLKLYIMTFHPKLLSQITCDMTTRMVLKM